MPYTFSHRRTDLKAVTSIHAALFVCLFMLVSFPWSLYSAQAEATPPSKSIALQLKNVDIVEVLMTLAEKGGLNIAVGPGVQGRVTLSLDGIDVTEALDIVIETAGLAYIWEGHTVKVMTQTQYKEMFGQKFKDRQITETVRLKNLNADPVMQSLSQLKSPTGKIVVDSKTNTIMMIDFPEIVKKMITLITEIDKPFTTKVFGLKYTTPSVISQAIQPFLTPSGRINMDTKTNKIIVTDTHDNIVKVSELVAMYDVVPYTESRVFSLSYADPQEVASKLTPELTDGVGLVQPITNTNNILITDLPQRFETLSDILTSLDVRTKEVRIEAKIVRVTLSDRFRMGINWEYVESKINDLDVRGTFNVLSTGDKGIRVTEGDLSEDKYTAMIEALQTVGKTNLLSNPRITAVHNKEAKILVGSTVPYTTIDTREENGVIRTFEKVTIVEVGTKLYVKPFIHEDGFISMGIKPEVSSVVNFNEDGIPVVETSQTETSILVKDGVTIILSGLIEKKETKTINKLPILGDIPGLKYLFSSRDTDVQNSELVLFITPHIITGEESTFDAENYQPFPERE